MNRVSKDAGTSFSQGVKFGLPIAAGYFACAITLGILATQVGLTAPQSALTSAVLMASAGELALFTAIREGAGLLEIALTELIANARYLLMSCAIGQRMDEKTPLAGRFIIGLTVTDELFGVAVTRPERIRLSFYLGMMAVAIPGWAGGTLLGAILGNTLSANAVTALGMGLYGMFLASVVPAAKHSRVLLVAVAVSMFASLAFFLMPLFAALNSGIRVILLTVLIAGAFAYFCPIPDDGEEDV